MQQILFGLFFALLLGLNACSDQDDSSQDDSKITLTHQEKAAKDLSPGDSVWSSIESSIQYNQIIALWKCDSNETPTQLLEKIHLNAKQDTMAKLSFDDFNKIIGIQARVADHKDFYWGAEYDIDSVHYVETSDLKAYRNDSIIWRESRVFGAPNFKLIERKRLSDPAKPLIHERFKYESNGVLISHKDLLLGETIHYDYQYGELTKEYIETKDGMQEEIIYEYSDQDGVRMGRQDGKLIIEEAIDSLGIVLSWREWDARGKEHCFTYVK